MASDGDRDRLVTPEVEAAEALAVLSRSSASGSGGHLKWPVTRNPQDGATAIQRSSGYTSSDITSPERIGRRVEAVRNQLGNTIYQPNHASKFRRNLTDADKEAQKLRRVLANRESARQTIHRRQVMHMELTKKAAELAEENENLKKRRGLMEEEHNSLKARNILLKTQMAEIRKDKIGGMQEEPKSFSQGEKIDSSMTSTTESYLYNQLPLVPCIWPCVIRPSDSLQCADFITSSQFPIPHGDISCSRQGQKYSSENNGPRTTPLVLLPVPWLLPFVPHSCNLHYQSKFSQNQNCGMCSFPDVHQAQADIPVSVNQGTRFEASDSTKNFSVGGGRVSRGQHLGKHPEGCAQIPGSLTCARTAENPRPSIWHSTMNSGVNADPVVTEHIRTHGSPQKTREPVSGTNRMWEEGFAATEARRRRKELMRLKINH